MSTLTVEKASTVSSRTHTFGLVGIVVAFLGLAGAIFSPLAFEVQRPPPRHLSDMVAETVVKIRQRVTKAEPPASEKRQTDWLVVAIIAASALGFIGAALGTVSWVRREDLRMSGAAVAVGVTAIAFHYIIAAIALAIFCIVVGFILSNLS